MVPIERSEPVLDICRKGVNIDKILLNDFLARINHSPTKIKFNLKITTFYIFSRHKAEKLRRLNDELILVFRKKRWFIYKLHVFDHFGHT